MKQDRQNKINKLLLDSILIDYNDNHEVDKFISELSIFEKNELLGVFTSNQIIEQLASTQSIYLHTEKKIDEENLFSDELESNNFNSLKATAYHTDSFRNNSLYYMNIFGVLQKIKLSDSSQKNNKAIDKCLQALNYSEDKDRIISLKNGLNSYSFNFKGARRLFESIDINELDKSVQNDWYLYDLGNVYSFNEADIKKLNDKLHPDYFNLEQALRILKMVNSTSHSFVAQIEKLYQFKNHFKPILDKENSVLQFAQMFLKNNLRHYINVATTSKLLKPYYVKVEKEVDTINISHTKAFIDFLNIDLTQNSFHQIKNLLINEFPLNQVLALEKEKLISTSWEDIISHNEFKILKVGLDTSDLLLMLDKKEPLFSYCEDKNLNKKQIFYYLIHSDIKDEQLHKIIKNNLAFLTPSDFNFTIKEKEHSAYTLLKKDYFATFDELMRVGFDIELTNREGKNLIEQLQSKKKYHPFAVILEQYRLEQEVQNSDINRKRIKI